MTNKKYNPFVDTHNFNANSSNWVQRLGHNADFYNNPLGYNSSLTPRPYDNTTDSGINNSFNINNRQPSSSGLESYNQPQKKQYTNPKVKPFTSWDIALSALEGFGEGAVGGIERDLNTSSKGLYDLGSDLFFDGSYEKRQKELEKLAHEANLDKLYKYSNYIIDNSIEYLIKYMFIKNLGIF